MDLLRATLRMAAPLLYAALGGAWTQQTGILNIGQEGAMLLASFFAILGNYHLGGWIAGVACGRQQDIQSRTRRQIGEGLHQQSERAGDMRGREGCAVDAPTRRALTPGDHILARR